MLPLPIKFETIKKSRLSEVSFKDMPFGKYYSDHILEADFADGKWQSVTIKPYAPFTIEPTLSALHYGQAIFEGIKAYKNKNGEVHIFRPNANHERFNKSAIRMAMPTVPASIFIDGLRELLRIDKDWVPTEPDHSVYIRPFMFSSDNFLGVKPSTSYKFMIVLSPSGPYTGSKKGIRIYVEDTYTRAVPGGVGFTKNAGNYGSSLYPTMLAQQGGYDQVLWTDPFEHKYLQEVGMMNVLFVIDKKIITPSLEDGTVLAGVTRNSLITLLKEKGYIVEERRISIDEIIAAHKKGVLQEMFGAGTAAVILPISKLTYKDYTIESDIQKWTLTHSLREALRNIQIGEAPDTHNWMLKV